MPGVITSLCSFSARRRSPAFGDTVHCMQLYVSIDYSIKDSLKELDWPLFKDFCEMVRAYVTLLIFQSFKIMSALNFLILMVFKLIKRSDKTRIVDEGTKPEVLYHYQY